MMNDTPHSPDPREELERKILLRSTNELPPEEAAALDALLGFTVAGEVTRPSEGDADLARHGATERGAGLLTSPSTGDTPAAFAHFVERELPLAAKAPRDFAAEAIAKAPRDFAAEAISAVAAQEPASNVVPFPLRKYATVVAAAAAVLVLAVNVLQNRPHKPDKPDEAQTAYAPPIAPTRTTAKISSRLDALEAELTEARSRVGRGRYVHSTTL
jgi:hypothetical protein